MSLIAAMETPTTITTLRIEADFLFSMLSITNKEQHPGIAIDMEARQSTHYPVHGRVQVALPNQIILSAHVVDISVEGICIVLQDQIPMGVVCPIRFEMMINGKDHVITALAKSIYCVLAGSDGFHVEFAFKEDDQQRTTLITSLAAKKPIAAASSKEPEH